jgi:Trp operon repressor
MEDEEKKIVLLVNFVQLFCLNIINNFFVLLFSFFFFKDKLNNMCSLFKIIQYLFSRQNIQRKIKIKYEFEYF